MSVFIWHLKEEMRTLKTDLYNGKPAQRFLAISVCIAYAMAVATPFFIAYCICSGANC